MPSTTWCIGLCTASLVAVLSGCEDRSPLAPTVAASQKTANPPFDPDRFVAVIDNPYLPLTPGTVYRYRSDTPDGEEMNLVRVTRDTRRIVGVTVTVVHDQVFLEGDLTEDTFDWFAQDVDGNVWYFGENSREIEDGRVVSTEGSWKAGVNGASPGIVMLAHPRVGLAYRQEDAPDIAEDMARVLKLDASAEVPYRSFDHCLRTMEWSLLEPGAREFKYYCPGVGLVLEDQPKEGHVRNELVAITRF